MSPDKQLRVNSEKLLKSLWKILIKPSEKSYTGTSGEIHQMLMINSKILPRNRIV